MSHWFQFATVMVVCAWLHGRLLPWRFVVLAEGVEMVFPFGRHVFLSKPATTVSIEPVGVVARSGTRRHLGYLLFDGVLYQPGQRARWSAPSTTTATASTDRRCSGLGRGGAAAVAGGRKVHTGGMELDHASGCGTHSTAGTRGGVGVAWLVAYELAGALEPVTRQPEPWPGRARRRVSSA